jgi:RNA polymerase sigma-70 factor (sigma-E family)
MVCRLCEVSRDDGGVAVDGHPSEPDGFRDFVEARSSALLRSGWLLTGDWPSAEDLVQTALAAAWPRWDSLISQDAPEPYVRKIMINTFLRWRQRRWNGEIATGRLPELQVYGDAFAQIDARQALIAALDRLPPRQRAVVVLRYFADQTEAQTAAAMGCSVGAVKAHASKALARLRDAPGLAELMTGGVAS